VRIAPNLEGGRCLACKEQPVVPLGSAEFHLDPDGKGVWKRDARRSSGASQPDLYWVFLSPVKSRE
jgi:hypothetical protein